MMLRTSAAFSLMEALIASIVFAVAVTGVFASLSAVKRPTTTTDTNYLAAKCTQQVFQSLRAKVDGRDYDDAASDLSVGVHTLTAGEIASFSSCAQLNTVSPITSLIYTVTNAGNDSRRVDAQIIWPDP